MLGWTIHYINSSRVDVAAKGKKNVVAILFSIVFYPCLKLNRIDSRAIAIQLIGFVSVGAALGGAIIGVDRPALTAFNYVLRPLVIIVPILLYIISKPR